MTKYRTAQASAVLSLLGSFLVFLSFITTSSDFMLVSTKDGRSALCVGNRAMFEMGQYQNIGVGVARCPQGVDAKPTVVAVTDWPWVARTGWFMLVLGLLLQLFSIEKTPTVEQIYSQINSYRKPNARIRESNPHTGLPPPALKV